jgi:2'-5' RNA ligase
MLDKLGAFPHERKPRVVYIGAREQGSTFRALAQRVRSAYAALGFPFEKDAVAHVTIARIKDPKRPLALVEFAPIRLAIERVTLFESLFDKTQSTSRYEIVATASLC